MGEVSGTRPSLVDRVAPIARFSPGWPFLIAGLIVVGAVMLVPAWRDVQSVRLERDRLQAVVDYEARRVEATEAMLAAVESGDPELERRLIAWQLNLLPAGDVALARVVSLGDAGAGYLLTTAEAELGVVIARSEAGAAMVPMSWTEMQCPVSCTKEGRKVAKVMPEQLAREAVS